MQSELNEATDKAAFLRWLATESLVAGVDDAEINRICQRWIKYQIRAKVSHEQRTARFRKGDRVQSLVSGLYATVTMGGDQIIQVAFDSDLDKGLRTARYARDFSLAPATEPESDEDGILPCDCGSRKTA